MKNDKKKRSLLQSYNLYTRIPAIILLVTVIVLITFAVLYAVFNALVFLILLISSTVVSFVLYAVYYFEVSRKLKNTIYQQIYKVTYDNINKIRNNDTNLISYGESDIK